MTEIFQEAIKGYNLPLTILVGLIALYWVISLLGLVDFDSIDNAMGLDGLDSDVDMDMDVDLETDMEMDVEVDADLDLDVDADADVDVGDADHHHDHDHGHLGVDHSPNAFQATLRFLGASDAPIMFVLTVFSLFAWGGNVLANLYFNGAESSSRANLLIIGVVIGALILTKITVRPLRPVMQSLRSSSVNKPVVGRTGLVKSLQLTEDYGQIEVNAEGASLLLNARLSDGFKDLPKGTEVLIVAKDDQRDLYIARPVSPETNPV